MQVNGFFKPWRIYFLAALIMLVLLYVYLVYARLAFSPQKKTVAKTPTVERGSIVDRNGKPLAVQTNFYHFGVTPNMIKNVPLFASKVAPVLRMDSDEVSAKIQENMGSSFVYIKKKLTQEVFEELEAIIEQNGYTAFSRFDRIPGRIYPENDLASQLIGYMGDDGQGLSGIEYAEQQVLSPPLTLAMESMTDVHGDNVYLTIDANLQFQLEKIAKEAMERTQAESMMVIASDAQNGEILSYISLPTVNLNNYTSASTLETIDRPAMNAYEPGSVFKIFTAAACVDSGVLTADTAFLCDGIYERVTNLGERIRITCLDHHGWVNVRNALKYSCNDGFAQMSDLMTTDRFLSYLHSFGFGERTGIELPAETRGTIKSPDDKYWSARTKPTMAIGQELSVNALQMVQAATIIANRGVPVKPTVIHRITDRYGTDKYVHNPEYGEQVIKASTAQYILSCMETVTKSGTGMRAGVDGFSIGVKTGTAQMADPVNGGYSDTDFLSNCLAIFPVESPKIILYIVIEKAKGETYAGRIVAPVISQAADEIINYLGLDREDATSVEHTGVISIAENAPLAITDTVPNFIGHPKRDLLRLLDNGQVHFIINGEGWVVSQNPAPGTAITENMTIELFLE